MAMVLLTLRFCFGPRQVVLFGLPGYLESKQAWDSSHDGCLSRAHFHRTCCRLPFFLRAGEQGPLPFDMFVRSVGLHNVGVFTNKTPLT